MSLEEVNITNRNAIFEQGVEYTIVSSNYLASLEDDSLFLNCLNIVGVDNWDGYDLAVECFTEELE